jgi:NAD(P)-dependent dehydrogenase (short-subunit alcohol dehydrogenase family)
MERHIVVTGACGAIGSEISSTLHEKGFKIIRICRKCPSNPEINCIQTDLSSIANVKNLAAHLIESYKVGVIVNNHATATRSRMEVQGKEVMLATNVLSYFWLSAFLVPLLQRTARETGIPSRIINVASTFAGNVDLEDLEMMRRDWSPTVAYKQSKALTRMMACGFSQLADVFVASCNPGVTPGKLTDILSASLPKGGIIDMWQSMASVSPRQAADTPIFLASDPNVAKEPSGQFYVGRHGAFDSEYCSDQAQLDKFWTLLAQHSQ